MMILFIGSYFIWNQWKSILLQFLKVFLWMFQCTTANISHNTICRKGVCSPVLFSVRIPDFGRLAIFLSLALSAFVSSPVSRYAPRVYIPMFSPLVTHLSFSPIIWLFYLIFDVSRFDQNRLYTAVPHRLLNFLISLFSDLSKFYYIKKLFRFGPYLGLPLDANLPKVSTGLTSVRERGCD